MYKTYKGNYRPKNPEKYVGDITNIVYRSSWERKLMKFLDENPNVLKWGSEEAIVPYISPIDNKIHRYFIDAYAKIKTKDGVKTYLIEVKPKNQTVPPKTPKKITKTYKEALKTYAVNQAKWDAAKKVCEERDWNFMILTEDHLL